MKAPCVCFFILIALFGHAANAQLLLMENFDYPVGDSLTGHGWTAHSGAGSNTIRTDFPGLIYPGYPANRGLSAVLYGPGEDINKTFQTASAGNIYVSFLVSVTSASTSGDYFLHLGPNPIGSTFRCRVFVRRDTSNNLAFGLLKGLSSGSPAYTPFVFMTNATYLCVVKYAFHAGSTTDDEVSLYIFSGSWLPASEPSSPTIGPLTDASSDLGTAGCVALRQGGAATAPNMLIDGIRVATSWSQAPLPVNLLAFDGQRLPEGVALHWKTASETGNVGFEIERSFDLDAWLNIGSVAACSPGSSGCEYFFTDASTAVRAARMAHYRLRQIDVDGSTFVSDVLHVHGREAEPSPDAQFYPLPFGNRANVRLHLFAPALIGIDLYALDGRERIHGLFDGFMPAGDHDLALTIGNLPDGPYIARIRRDLESRFVKVVVRR